MSIFQETRGSLSRNKEIRLRTEVHNASVSSVVSSRGPPHGLLSISCRVLLPTRLTATGNDCCMEFPVIEELLRNRIQTVVIRVTLSDKFRTYLFRQKSLVDPKTL